VSSPEGMKRDPRAFRAALGTFATGVTIVTTRGGDGEDIGITANSFNSVSLDPPMVLWSLSRKARSLQAFLDYPHFAVHVLSSDQDALSHLFATQGADKFHGLSITRGAGDVALLDGCSARFECRTAFRYDGGDHVILVGEVVDFQSFDRSPLLFHAGKYIMAVQRQTAEPEEWDTEPDSSFSRDFLVYLLSRAHQQLQAGLRTDLSRHDLNEQEWFVLSLLGVSDDRMIAELDQLLWHTGHRVTYERVARLAAAGLVTLQGGHDPNSRVKLTSNGRALVIQLVAAAKAVESHAARNLGAEEIQLLKNALRRLIRDNDPGPPPLLTDPD